MENILQAILLDIKHIYINQFELVYDFYLICYVEMGL
jgi:hypothetical protein